ncbi:MAG: acetylxylan esterase [Prevotella sp.]|nr:acetylxylan esterase [Prevotella sp.]
MITRKIEQGLKGFIVLSALLVAVLDVSAQIRGNNIVVTVEPDHKDWNYKVGQTAQFTVEVRRSGTLVDNVSVNYEAGPEMYPDVKRENVVLKDGTMKWKGSMKKPGFYRLKVTATVDGRKYDGLCTAAFSPEQLQPTTENPQDFDAFWSKAIEEARWTSLEPTKTLLPERSTKDVNVYEVSFQNVRWGSRTYGILCVPVKEGKYPALLRVPGAGVRPYQGDVWTAAQGAITLEIGIHGVSVTQPQSFYDNLQSGALNCYWEFGMDDRDKSYYKRVVLGCIRAIDFIEQFTPWDGKNLGVTGSSQGGFLSLATAGLDKRVSCYGAVHSALCDHTASLKKVACGWPHYFYGKDANQLKKAAAHIETSRYYDGVNFARRITCPGWFSFGYNDDVVPPTTAYATYNIVTAPKVLSPYQQTGHYWYQEQWDEWTAWLMKQLGIKN